MRSIIKSMSLYIFAILTIICVAIIIRYKHRNEDLLVQLQNKTREASSISGYSDVILQNLGVFIFLVTKDFIVIKTNYYEITHTPKSEIPIRLGNVLRCKNGEDAGVCGKHEACKKCLIRDAISKSFLTREGFEGLEVPVRLYKSSDKTEYIDQEVSLSGAFLHLNGQDQLLVTLQDITKLKNIQYELFSAKKAAEEADKQKSAFVANMSHEIRTPLNAIVGFSGLVAASTDPEQKKHYMRIIQTNNDLLLRLVNDILDMSKIEAGTLDFNYSEVDLNQIMRELEQSFRFRLEGLNSSVQIYFEQTRPSCYIHTEKNRVSQVIVNFITNAIKFTAQGSITMGYEVRENDIFCYVKDTGVGIAPNRQTQVFERFTKLDTRKQGTGLGLSICKSIIKKLEGQIGVESELGKGSTFWFTLPVLPLDIAPKTIEQEELEKTYSVRVHRTLLIAEDIEDNYLLCRAYLENKYSLLRAHDGEEAISLFLQHSPDAILMDLRMPSIDGYQATEAIRQMSSTIPIIAVTAYASEEDRSKVLVRGFSGYLAKPLKRGELLDTLRQAGV